MTLPGNRIVNVVPSPAKVSKLRSQLYCAQISLLIDRPSPVPLPMALVVKKGSEQLGMDLLRNSAGPVFDLDPGTSPIFTTSNQQTLIVGRVIISVNCIQHQIHYHLLQLDQFGLNHRIHLRVALQRHALLAQAPRLNQFAGTFDHFGQKYRLGLGQMRTRE